ncbi:MAG: hypothetical protein Q4G69_09275 [Planctomycetia bacterium]|nr:hypothetical protein [Planctomycetia bacterium]
MSSDVELISTENLERGTIDHSRFIWIFRPGTFFFALLLTLLMVFFYSLLGFMVNLLPIGWGALLVLWELICFTVNVGGILVGIFAILIVFGLLGARTSGTSRVSGRTLAIGFGLILLLGPGIFFTPLHRDSLQNFVPRYRRVADNTSSYKGEIKKRSQGKGVLIWPILCFSGYLVLLGGSALCLSIMSREGAIKRRKGIRGSCPHPDCIYEGDPLYLCPYCQTLIEDLRPSIFGLFHARCGNCGKKIPASDLMGRNNLVKVCPGCGQMVENSLFGALPELHFIVVGASKSGKSNFLRASIQKMEEFFADYEGWDFQYKKTENQKHKGNPEKKKRMFSLASGKPGALNVSLITPYHGNFLIYLYDSDDYDEGSDNNLIKHIFHQYTSGIFLVIDLFAEESYRNWFEKNSPETLVQANPATTPIDFVVDRLANRMERVTGSNPEETIDIPVAVILTKGDIDRVGQRIGGYFDVNDFTFLTDTWLENVETYSNRIRESLFNGKLGPIVNKLELSFSSVAYFAVSGCIADEQKEEGTEFENARGALAPFLWIMRYNLER